MKEFAVNKIAAVQMVSTASLDANLVSARRLIGQAVAEGAQLVLLPEYWALMGMHESDKVAIAEQPGHGPIQDFLAEMARSHRIIVIGGTLPLAASDPRDASKVFNTTLVYDAQGMQIARYDKIHLFGFNKDAESYDEARTIVAGHASVGFAAPFGRVGLSVCYDLRFPELYRQLGTCALLVVPAAFTYTTGRAHWEILLRARAIENQCYVLASAQGGIHENGRRTWGHSMLIDPWGEIVALLPEGEGVIGGVIDPARLDGVRQNLPALAHRKL